MGKGISGSGQNMIIQNNQISNIWQSGMDLMGCGDCQVEENIIYNIHEPSAGIDAVWEGSRAIGNQISNAYIGIYDKCENTGIIGNQISQCNIGYQTIVINQSIEKNNITDCDVGLYLEGPGNTISEFVITDCDTGIYVSEIAENNVIYGNDFIENRIQVSGRGARSNEWDWSGSGNYWSDYYGFDEDSDGIGDTPFLINNDVYDRYPLMSPANFSIQSTFSLVEMEGITHDQLSAGDTNVVITKITMQKSATDSSKVFEWIGLRLDRVGKGEDVDVSSIKIWRDINNNSIVENTVDSLLGSGIFNDGESYISFNSNKVITINPSYYLISLDVSDNISKEGNTIGVGFEDSTYFICKFPAKVKNSNFPFSTTEILITDISEFELSISYSLSQNYPNPFNSTTRINYSIPMGSFVSLIVYDILGREVTTSVNEKKPRGHYGVEFDRGDLSSGIYYYRIHAGDFVETKKLVLIK